MIRKYKSLLSLAVMVAFLLGFSGMLLAAKDDQTQGSQAPKVIASDTKGAGKPDRWEYYENGVLMRIEADTNGDGKVDEWAEVKDGKIVSAKKDSNYDGKVDRWINY
ncbi:MAG: hypothetical protein HZC17_09135 [Candidatus Omnitrophica bacterium]|nr:hypothetical protein [Candidatus Omnitrophota bacterium]